jgi:hypothetical protein
MIYLELLRPIADSPLLGGNQFSLVKFGKVYQKSNSDYS